MITRGLTEYMNWRKFAESLEDERALEGALGAEPSKAVVFRFGAFELDEANCELRHSGVLIDIPPQAFRILTMLVRRPNELVTREEVRKILWPAESSGDFDSRLNFEIRRIREALRDDADRPRYVATMRKRGYKFIASVQGAEPGNSGLAADTGIVRGKTSLHSETSQTSGGGEQARLRGFAFRVIAVSVLLAVAVNLALFAFWVRKKGGHEQTLHLYAPIVDQTTGTVVIQGVDTARPRTPFRFEWGDGTTSIGWFPQKKIYPKVGHSYKVHVVATYQDGSHADASVAVDVASGGPADGSQR